MLEHDKGLYDADLAHHRSRQRAERPRRPKLRLDADLRAEVQTRLDLEWSPEQIAAHLRTLGLTSLSGTCATRPSTVPSTRARKAS